MKSFLAPKLKILLNCAMVELALINLVSLRNLQTCFKVMEKDSSLLCTSNFLE